MCTIIYENKEVLNFFQSPVFEFAHFLYPTLYGPPHGVLENFVTLYSHNASTNQLGWTVQELTGLLSALKEKQNKSFLDQMFGTLFQSGLNKPLVRKSSKSEDDVVISFVYVKSHTALECSQAINCF